MFDDEDTVDLILNNMEINDVLNVMRLSKYLRTCVCAQIALASAVTCFHPKLRRCDFFKVACHDLRIQEVATCKHFRCFANKMKRTISELTRRRKYPFCTMCENYVRIRPLGVNMYKIDTPVFMDRNFVHVVHDGETTAIRLKSLVNLNAEKEVIASMPFLELFLKLSQSGFNPTEIFKPGTRPDHRI